jgi:cyclic pyranopterin phosphate synthase
MSAATLAMIEAGAAKKGDVLGVARLAGIMAAKRTSELIPLCHPLPITAVVVELTADRAANAIEIAATVRTTGQTGVEMEALTAASVAALTVYDMCKAVDRGMRIEDLRVVHKAGGKSGEFAQP